MPYRIYVSIILTITMLQVVKDVQISDVCPFLHVEPSLDPLNSLHQRFRLSDAVMNPGVRSAMCPLPIYPAPSSHTFTRTLISNVFGGSVRALVSAPAAHRVKSGNTLNFCCRPKWAPWGPRIPGETGFIFVDPIGPEAGNLPNPGPNGLTVFYRVRQSEWLYLGQYRGSIIEPLSGAEWATIPEKVLLRIYPLNI